MVLLYRLHTVLTQWQNNCPQHQSTWPEQTVRFSSSVHIAKLNDSVNNSDYTNYLKNTLLFVLLRDLLKFSMVLPQVSVPCVFQTLSINLLCPVTFWVGAVLACKAMIWWMILLFLKKFPAGWAEQQYISSWGTYKDYLFLIECIWNWF